MYHQSFNSIDFSKFYDAPIPCKIMGLLLAKNVLIGVYYGVREFKTHEQPITNMYDQIISNTIWGVIEAFLWPITFPHSVLSSLDKVVNHFRKIEN